jgi:hypothetical protein
LALHASAAALPAGAKRAGTVITAEGGVDGGVQVIRYDADGRPMDGSAPSRPDPSRPLAPSLRPAAQANAAPAPAPANKEMLTPDGRKLPFSMDGQGAKNVDGSVDFNSALRKVGKTSEASEKRFDTTMAPVGKEQVYSRNNLLTLDSWHGRYDTFGRKKSDIAVEDTLGAPVQTKDMVQVKSIDRTTAAVNGSKAEVKAWEHHMGVEANDRYTGVKSSLQGVLNPNPKTVDQLSMQDINRFQFRRNRSDEPGLPTVKPGSDSVQTKGGLK